MHFFGLGRGLSLLTYNLPYTFDAWPQGIASDELELVDPHHPLRQGRRGGEHGSSTVLALRPRVWQAKFRGVAAVAKEACPNVVPSKYERKALANKAARLERVNHPNVLRVLGLVTAPLAPARPETETAKEKEAALVPPGDLMGSERERGGGPSERERLLRHPAQKRTSHSTPKDEPHNDARSGEQVLVVVLELFAHGVALDPSAYEAATFTAESFGAVGSGVVAGLAALHAANVAHGSLCPANVLVDFDARGQVQRETRPSHSATARARKRGATIYC